MAAIESGSKLGPGWRPQASAVRRSASGSRFATVLRKISFITPLPERRIRSSRIRGGWYSSCPPRAWRTAGTPHASAARATSSLSLHRSPTWWRRSATASVRPSGPSSIVVADGRPLSGSRLVARTAHRESAGGIAASIWRASATLSSTRSTRCSASQLVQRLRLDARQFGGVCPDWISSSLSMTKESTSVRASSEARRSRWRRHAKAVPSSAATAWASRDFP